MADARQKIGEYELRSLLQTGQTSQVYEVVEPRSGRHFAMKLLLPEFADNKHHRKILFHEAEIGVKLRHENVINIIKVSKSETTPNFVMEFFPSGSLRNRLLSKDPKEKEFLKVNARKIFKQVATGLAYMNSSGVVHCDIKADNILSNALGQTKIIDFAISKPVMKGFFAKLFYRPGKPQGTPSFMSPEQILGKILDGRSDIYSYGATLYELTTGRPPFRGTSMNELLQKHISEKPVAPSNYNTDLTDEFSALVVKMLAKRPEQRPGHFHEILMELKKIKIFKSIVDKDDDDAM
ncbi:MAG: serine/threonine protein kinase [Fimbriiglobus sp.]